MIIVLAITTELPSSPGIDLLAEMVTFLSSTMPLCQMKFCVHVPLHHLTRNSCYLAHVVRIFFT